MGKLAEAAAEQPDEVPADWKTTRQWAEEEGISINQAGTLLRGLVRGGKWECRKFRVQCSTKIYPTHHYREKPAARPRGRKS